MTVVLSHAYEATASSIASVLIPDTKPASEITELLKDTEPPMLFHHSSRVYYWGALTGKRRGLRFDPELLYAGAMFHDMGRPAFAYARHERRRLDEPPIPRLRRYARGSCATARGSTGRVSRIASTFA